MEEEKPKRRNKHDKPNDGVYKYRRVGMEARDQVFFVEFLKDFQGEAAAIRAGVPEKGAKYFAYNILRTDYAKEKIASLIAERCRATMIDAEWVLKRLAEEAEADIADLYDDHGALKPVKEWPKIWRQGLVGGLDVEELRVDGAAVGIIKKIKLSDRVKRLELIGKHIDVGAFRDRVEHTGKDGGPIEIEAKAGVSGMLLAARQAVSDADTGTS